MVNKGTSIYLTISGSRAYGVANEESDWDFRGVYCDTYADLTNPWHTQTFDKTTRGFPLPDGANGDDIHWYELRTFARLAADGSPNVLEMLFTPCDCVLFETPSLRTIRKLLCSKAALAKYHGFARSEWARYERSGSPKRAYHALRILEQAALLAWRWDQPSPCGDIAHTISPDFLKCVKEGDADAKDIEDAYRARKATLRVAEDFTTMPDRPDRTAIADAVSEIYRFTNKTW